jgi:predicted amidophosphoribosyltransferase
MMDSLFCPSCGKKVARKAKFCWNCGEALVGPQINATEGLDGNYPCPYCNEDVTWIDTVCPHCTEELYVPGRILNEEEKRLLEYLREQDYETTLSQAADSLGMTTVKVQKLLQTLTKKGAIKVGKTPGRSM